MQKNHNARSKQALPTLLATPFWNISSISPEAFPLYEQALTHSTFANEQRAQGHDCADNERLEFLGDRVLNCAVADFLFQHYDQLPEGILSDKIKFTQNANLACIVKAQTPDIKHLLLRG